MPRRPQGTGSLYQRGDVWWCQYFRHGVRYRESTGETERDAAQRFLSRRLGQTDVTPERATVSDLVDLVIEDYEIRGLRSVADVRWRVERHLRPLLGSIPASKLTRHDMTRYVAWRRKQEASDATINRELAIIRRGCNLGRQQEPPLIARVPYIPALAEDNARQGFLEPETLDRLIGELPERLRALTVVGYHVGMRLGELLSLRWDQVDMAALAIRLTARQTKGKTARTVPVYGEMERWLTRQQESCPAGCSWVFHYRGGRVGSHLDGWREACTRAGIPDLLFHDLRRSAVRNMVRAGIPEATARAISGHKTRAIFDRYNIVSEADLTEAAGKLTEYIAARKRPKLRRVK